jgi:hypothetical protein
VQGYLTAPHIGCLCWVGSMVTIWWAAIGRFTWGQGRQKYV